LTGIEFNIPNPKYTVHGHPVNVFLLYNHISFPDHFTPPTLTGTSPADGSQDVGVDELVVATLSEALDPASVTPTSLSLTAGGADVLGIAALGVGNTSIEFTPDALLTTFTDYQATLTSTVADPAVHSGALARGSPARS